MRRVWQSSFFPLLLLDAVTVATFARCFTGPGELWLLVPVCAGAQVVAHGARMAGARGWKLASAGIWVLSVLLVAWVPVLALDASRVAYGFPAGHGGTVLARQLSQAWHIFSVDVSPVRPQTGLVLAAAWAAGVVALAAEAIDADSSLPALVAMVPAFDIVLFTGTLGTSTGRPLELAALGALGVWYLGSSVGRSRREQVVVARIDARSPLESTDRPTGLGRLKSLPRLKSLARLEGAPGSTGTKPAQPGLTRVAAPGLVVLAAVAAGIVGPLIPGANSPALVAWHGSLRGTGAGGHHGSGGTLQVSTLVQVGEQEVDNPNTVLATVHSSLLTREVLTTLNDFNGNQWTPARSTSQRIRLGSISRSLSSLERNPPPESFVANGAELTQVISLRSYGGPYLPAPGDPVAISGVRVLPEASASGPLVPTSGLHSGETYAVTASLDSPPPAGYVSDPAAEADIVPPGGLPLSVDQALPQPVPASIVHLARSLVRNATTQLQEADDLVAYFTQSRLFRYSLPKKLPSGAISDTGEGYAALEQFLFTTRVGYCQQYASAFAVLARVLGMPTRIVVGLIPGQATGGDSWQITGQDVHAWPQVYFPGSGWSDFEPTPSTPAPFQFPRTPGGMVPVTTTTVPGGTGTTVTTLRSNLFTHTPDKPHPRAGARHPSRGVHPSSLQGGVSPTDLFLGFLALATLWAISVPLARLVVSRRRRRNPSDGVVASWREVVRALAAAGYHRRRTETYSEFAQRVRLAGVLSSPADDCLRRLTLDLNRACFGRGPLAAADLVRAASYARVVRRAAWRKVSWRQRLLAELDPRDLVRAT